MLSKYDVQSFVQCPRRLWLEHHRQDLAPPEDSSWNRRAVDGRIVGEKARELLGAGVLWPPSNPDRTVACTDACAMLATTPGQAAVEFPMVREILYARADALLPVNGGYRLRETKASTFPLKDDKVTPKEPQEHHLLDVAIQAWVMEGLGLKVEGAELHLINNQWRYAGDGDYSQLFRSMDVTDAIEDWKADVEQLAQDAQKTLNGRMPATVTGKQCRQPYECPYQRHCKELDPPGPEHPVELLPDSAGKNLARKLRDDGFDSLPDVPPERLVGKAADLYKRIQRAHTFGKAVFDAGSDKLLEALPYPRYYFDFEGIDLPVPVWKGLRPYEQVPFQWSCHIERAPGVFEHHEFLDPHGSDPSLACIQRMRETIADDGGPIFVYHATYESTVMKNLGIRHPEHEPLMAHYTGRLVDLLPMVKNHFYDPQMEGSFSIKKVLPVVAPDLDYGELDEVQEGVAAQVAYLYIAFDPHISAARRAELIEKLRIYCRQDTWAMVEVAYFLARMPRPTRPANM